MGRRPAHESLATKTDLLRAAAAAFAEHGFNGATIADIASRAGVTTGAIYRHFENKEDLLVSAAWEAATKWVQIPRPSPTRPESLAEVATRIARLFMAPGNESTRRLFIELHLSATRSPRIAALLARLHRGIPDEWRWGIPPGAGSPQAVTKVLSMFLLGLSHLDGFSSIEASPEEIETIVSRLMHALFEGSGS